MNPITSQCAPSFAGSTYHTIESFPEGKYKERESERVSEGTAESSFADEVRRLVAIRTKVVDWEPLVVRLLDASDLEVQRVVIK